jgi:hypothetical protein
VRPIVRGRNSTDFSSCDVKHLAKSGVQKDLCTKKVNSEFHDTATKEKSSQQYACRNKHAFRNGQRTRKDATDKSDECE